MKKIVLTVFVAALAVCTAYSQPRSVGGHLGYQIGAEYQHTLGNNFIEVDLEVPGYKNGLVASAQYNWLIASPAWTSRGVWDFYAGAGLATGAVRNSYVERPGKYTGFLMALSGQVGLSYTFWFPMMISLDWRPKIGMAFGEANWIYTDWAYMFAPTIGVKYCF